ncbi:MAG: transposase [Tannerellaceae bacterium]|nr:transposase [Tannerellaceae bacterium]
MKRNRVFKDIATVGKSTMGWFYGFKLHLVVNDRASLCELLFEDGLHLVTGIKNNMKNRLMSMRDKILLRKRSVIETINDEQKTMVHPENA